MPGLAAKVRAKYPGAYDDINDADLERQVLAKHPEYADLATPAAEGREVPPPEAILAISRRRVKDATGASDQAASAPDWKANLAALMEPAAHPQSAGDIAGLLIPGQVEGVLRTVGTYGRALKQGMQARPAGVTGLLSVPARAYQALKSSLPTEMAKDIDAFRGPQMPAVPAAAPRITTGGTDLWDTALQDARTARATQPAAAPAGLSAEERAGLAKQGYPPEVIAKIDAQAAQPAPMASHAPTAPPQPELQGPRIRAGAERVGRQAGMSTQDVRQAAGPVLDEARGEASPILPQNALGSIVDTLKAMPPGSPEREAYVARATSGKTKWQVENIRRTLEHLGLIVPAAVGVREGLMRMMASHEPTTETP